MNTVPRTNPVGNVIDLQTDGAGEFITLDNSGTLTATNAAGTAIGIYTRTNTAGSFIDITNSGDIEATGGDGGTNGGNAFSIYAGTFSVSRIDIDNSGDLEATGGDGGTGDGGRATGIRASTLDGNSAIGIVNSGDIWGDRWGWW